MGVRYLRTKYRSMKPKFDRIAGTMLLVAFAPVIGFIALLVKLTSRGPAFYKQERVGEYGRTFNIIKVRTMRCDAETKSGPIWAEAKDSRVTLIGGVLRASHLDELPQLVNVVRGEMSLVGPRPERPYFVQQLRERIPGYELRHTVKPGITGLAQVRAGADHALRDVRRKVKLDIMYAQRMCWWVDFIIIVRTMSKFVDSGERRG
jgi:lipopolysaccharide/colanic/teichoic acid biosynthesis glycosyltransferase